ncbi:MAG: hypothetical protein U0521_25530 [Anaerolineae bacterium]
MQFSKRARFRIAAAVSAVAIAFAVLRIFGTEAYTAGAYGWIRIYPPPLEIVLITLGVTLVVAWMWQWYRRDRVQQALALLNDEERHDLVRQIAGGDFTHLELRDDDEYEPASVPRKRKRVEDD